MLEVPRDIFWQGMTGDHAKFAVGHGPVRRYAPGISPIAAFEDNKNPDLATLAEFFQPGESFYTDDWSGSVPEDWNVELESTMFKMIWDAPKPESMDTTGMVELNSSHAEQALELAVLTNPGPFGLRTLELGEYFGYFDGSRLIAMAGERIQAGAFREISGVCTHPDYQGRGLARKLMLHVVSREIERGQIPFLHVVSANEVARGLYHKIGFRDSLETVVRRLARIG